ncbi:MAG TPA: hypothetical protein VHX39_09450 [Acetobacteraceae bacterium]|jgi:hypothetical protein|nr:hypothetical protein [Acetobacteraceae bacterium]
MYGRSKGSIWSHPVNDTRLTAAANHNVLEPGFDGPEGLPPGGLLPGDPLPGPPVVVPGGVPGADGPGAFLNILRMNDLIAR